MPSSHHLEWSSPAGVIVGVDEDTAYSWPVCNRCKSQNLQLLPGGKWVQSQCLRKPSDTRTNPRLCPLPRSDSLRCGSCERVVDKPDTRIQLEVYLTSSFGDGTLKVKVRPAWCDCSVRLWARPAATKTCDAVFIGMKALAASVISPAKSAELIGPDQRSYQPADGFIPFISYLLRPRVCRLQRAARVFMAFSSRRQLRQKTIESILNAAALEGDHVRLLYQQLRNSGLNFAVH